jgi:hypothetical protein
METLLTVTHPIMNAAWDHLIDLVDCVIDRRQGQRTESGLASLYPMELGQRSFSQSTT